ncbi:IclR family transcriptional regulator [Desulfoluna sp.]|uniref:IclR family transcriptional regulator n=1 Tax=Desulfoluna sp. TaxID=2045199 RepID=UPI002613056F|nr:IclR family transcriptional regulator [Desulfoluna sp.]
MAGNTIHSIGKAFEIIDVMSRQPQWELGEICRATGLPKTTVFRIVLTLTELGYVTQEQKGGRYQLTLELFKIGSRVVSQSGLVDLARPACRALLAAVDETVNLTVPEGTDMVVVDKLGTTQVLRPDSVIGTSFPIYRSASGKIYLAFLPDTEMDDMLRRITQEDPTIREADLAELRREFVQLRRDGLAYDNEEIYLGVRCVAAPIFDHTGHVIATISCSVPSIRITDDSAELVASEVNKTAKTISCALGATVGHMRA